MPKLGARPVATGLTRPVCVTAPPGDTTRLFLVEKDKATGQENPVIKVLNLSSGQINPAPFLAVTGVKGGGEMGLLGLAFHPNYADNGFFYVNFTDPSVATVIRRYKVSAANPNLANPSSAVTVLTIPQPAFPNHKCGWIAFGPHDRMLYIGTGDGGDANDPGNRAQKLGDLLGKMLRIDVNGDDFPGDTNRNYAIPPNNPFRGQANARPEIWAYGLRNPWRNSFDRETGDLYIADVGQDDLEEINLQRGSSLGGENYGWRPKEGTRRNPSPDVPEEPPAGLTDPIYQYSHDIGRAIVGGPIYRGRRIANLAGSYFFADHITNKVWSFRYEGAITDFLDRTAELSQSAGPISRISAFGEDAAGELYIVSLNGTVFQIVAAS